MTSEIQSKETTTKLLPKILNEIKNCSRAANEAATSARLAVEEAKRAKEAEDKARKETREAMKRARKAVQEAKRAQKVEAKVRKEADRAAREMVKRKAVDTEQRARGEIEALLEQAWKETGEAKSTKETEPMVSEELDLAASYKANREAEEAKHEKHNEPGEVVEKIGEQVEKEAEEASAELYSGVIKLALGRQVQYESVRRFQLFLSQVQNLRLISVGGSVPEGTTMAVSAEKPIPLLSLLRETPLVKEVVGKGKEIQIKLKPEQ